MAAAQLVIESDSRLPWGAGAGAARRGLHWPTVTPLPASAFMLGLLARVAAPADKECAAMVSIWFQ